MKLKKGDTIKIIKGKDRGKTGKVINVDRLNNKITAEGLNLFKKHSKPKRQGQKGEVILVTRPLNAANAMIVCPACKQTARVGYRFENDVKLRLCKKCKSKI
ncbi:MAG: 50S ribosomal protein L24 [Candidatus Brennerbacteria bacterium]|nr:50S ribosomal protein L24 [Candidatus Brennerbacteria bacterium]